MRILVTDDNLINQKVASRLLSQLGYQADIAKSGREAIQALERVPYDLVFMDVQMPEMNGLEATSRIREIQKSSHPKPHFNRPVVIIAMTANAMHGDREKCLAMGMDEYIPKPVRTDTLQRMLTHFGKKMLQTGQTPAPSGAIVSELPVAAGPASQPPSAPLDAPHPSHASLPTLPTHEDPVDLDRLFDFSGGSMENLEEIIALYLKQTVGQLNQMQTALRDRQAETLGNVAHSCAGASATCGMRTMVPPLRRLEMAGKAEDLQSCAQILQETSVEFNRIKQYLETRPWTQPHDHDIPKSIAI
jgi:CheY-like chemotaxis protein